MVKSLQQFVAAFKAKAEAPPTLPSPGPRYRCSTAVRYSEPWTLYRIGVSVGGGRLCNRQGGVFDIAETYVCSMVPASYSLHMKLSRRIRTNIIVFGHNRGERLCSAIARAGGTVDLMIGVGVARGEGYDAGLLDGRSLTPPLREEAITKIHRTRRFPVIHGTPSAPIPKTGEMPGAPPRTWACPCPGLAWLVGGETTGEWVRRRTEEATEAAVTRPTAAAAV